MKNIKKKLKEFLEFFGKHSDLIGYICLALFFVYMNLEISRYLEVSLESDMSSELVLGKLLAEEKKIITTSWFYSTEIRVLNTNLIFAPLFMLISNWKTVRMVGMMIIEIILFVAYYFVAKKVDLKHIPWIAFMVVGAISKDYYKVVILDSCYVPHLVITLFSVGLLVAIFKDENRKSIKHYLKVCGLMLLAFIGSLEGVRLPSVTYLPLFAAAVLTCFFKQFDNLKEGKFDFKDETFYLVIIAFLVLVSGLAGWVFNREVFQRLGFLFKTDGTEIRYKEFSFDSLSMVINGWLNDLGYQSDGILIFTPIQLIIKPLWAVFMIILVWATVDMIVNHKKYDRYEMLVFTFYMTSACIMSLLYTFTDAWYRDRYFLPVSIFSPIVVGMFLKHYKIVWQKAVYITFIVMFMLVNTRFQIHFRADNNEYAAYTKINKILLENECYNGVSNDHWEGHNILTELSNGRIETWRVFVYDEMSHAFPWLQAVEHNWRLPSGKTYLIKGIHDDEGIEFKKDPSAFMCYQDDYRTVYIFDSFEQLQEYVA